MSKKIILSGQDAQDYYAERISEMENGNINFTENYQPANPETKEWIMSKLLNVRLFSEEYLTNRLKHLYKESNEYILDEILLRLFRLDNNPLHDGSKVSSLVFELAQEDLMWNS